MNEKNTDGAVIFRDVYMKWFITMATHDVLTGQLLNVRDQGKKKKKKKCSSKHKL